MRIAYHPTAASLAPAALSAWLAATVADIAAAPAPGVMANITPPNYPAAFETGVVADDRTTQGGVAYSHILYQGRMGTLDFTNVPHGETATWRAWHAATLGFRLPSIIELDSAYAIVAPVSAFPLQLVKQERWAGRLEIREALGWL